jgi:ABC-type transporter Mla maintaining outer membrane lipid asymmetry permease subunit MlaE
LAWCGIRSFCNYSLLIISVSGCLFVLALQGYHTLQRYGSAEALGFRWLR